MDEKECCANTKEDRVGDDSYWADLIFINSEKNGKEKDRVTDINLSGQAEEKIAMILSNWGQQQTEEQISNTTSE